MSVTRVAYLKRTTKNTLKKTKSNTITVTASKRNPVADHVTISIVSSGCYDFVRCHKCYDFIPANDVIISAHRPNVCNKCGSQKISYLSASTGKLFEFVSEHI